MAGPTGFTHGERVWSDATARRLCLRPERQPGVAPDCEEAREETPRKRITLPKLKFLECEHGQKSHRRRA
jgi:hypothetical protein